MISLATLDIIAVRTPIKYRQPSDKKKTIYFKSFVEGGYYFSSKFLDHENCLVKIGSESDDHKVLVEVIVAKNLYLGNHAERFFTIHGSQLKGFVWISDEQVEKIITTSKGYKAIPAGRKELSIDPNKPLAKIITREVYVGEYNETWIDRWYNNYCKRKGRDRHEWKNVSEKIVNVEKTDEYE